MYCFRNNPEPEELHLPGSDGVFTSQYFNATNLIKVATHGWLGKANATWLQNLKDEFLIKDDFNVILVDWSEIAQNIIYPWSAFCTRYVGKKTAKLLDAIAATYNISGANMHLLGHSLGSQVMGYTGLFSNHNIGRITGKLSIEGYNILTNSGDLSTLYPTSLLTKIYSFRRFKCKR